MTRTRVAALLFYTDAFIWLMGMVPTLYYTFTRNALPRLGDIRLLGGPFESLGVGAFLVAGLMYIFVSALKIQAAYWLWNGRRDGAVLGLILLGLSILFWYGFAIPLGPLLGIAQVIVLAVVWSDLK